jgi:hypothetical protein
MNKIFSVTRQIRGTLQNRKFTAVLTRACRWLLSRVSSQISIPFLHDPLQLIPPMPSGLFPSCFVTKMCMRFSLAHAQCMSRQRISTSFIQTELCLATGTYRKLTKKQTNSMV